MRRRAPHHWLWLLAIGLLAAPAARAEPRLAYVKGRMIYTARAADGRDQRPVCAGGSPCISHDGRCVAYTRDDGAPGINATRTIVVRDLASGRETDLPNDTRRQVFAALWSPDDAWIAYNALGDAGWQVAVAHPDGGAFHRLTDKLPNHDRGYFLAGWNLHDGAVLAHDGQVAVQLDPDTGGLAWTRPVGQFTDDLSAGSETRFTVSADGRQVIYVHSADEKELPDLALLSTSPYYLVIADFLGGKARRVTPERFTVFSFYVGADGASVFLSGVHARDVRPRRSGDGLDMKERLYRCDLRSGRLTLLAADGEELSVSR